MTEPFLIGEKQPVCPVYPVGYVLYRLTSHITPMPVLIRVAKVAELFLEFIFVEEPASFCIMVLYDGQGRVLYDTGDVYHVVQVSEVIAVVQFYRQCLHDIIIAHCYGIMHYRLSSHGQGAWAFPAVRL